MSALTTNRVPIKKLVSKRAIADYFQITTRTVENWHARGWITGYRLAPTMPVRFDLEEVIEAMQKGKAGK